MNETPRGHAGIIAAPGTPERPSIVHRHYLRPVSRDRFASSVLGTFTPRRPAHRRRPAVRWLPIGIGGVVITMLFVLAGLIGSTPAPAATAPMMTYSVTGQPGELVSVGWSSPGKPGVPLRVVTLAANGRWNVTVPADGWTGGANVPVLSAMRTGVIAYNARPGIACAITQAGVPVSRDSEPGEFFCLTSPDARYQR